MRESPNTSPLLNTSSTAILQSPQSVLQILDQLYRVWPTNLLIHGADEEDGTMLPPLEQRPPPPVPAAFRNRLLRWSRRWLWLVTMVSSTTTTKHCDEKRLRERERGEIF
ncbi:hypothetical protein TSUD_242460 [Trifolium subterraneum]|uniref:Uncharacterized protein n=1 Tax=Trifolium subterraneum TaxID=3900 RepID=A0A2Z6PUK5_TRISU|nr:hypothetical protein TSUD_242460 [Trifolium subterraneum]